MPKLDSYLVALGMKGQDIVLSTMDKIRKKGGDLSKKKTTVLLSTKTTRSKPEGSAEKSSLGIPTPEKPVPGTEKSSDGKSTAVNLQTEKFKKAADKFHGGVKDFASAASTLDPTTTIASVTSAIGTSLSGISVLGVSLGRLPEGIAAIANSTLSMAKNSMDMAKQATAAFYQLTTRNAAAEHYGGKIGGQDQLSRNERAMFIDAVSGSMGKIGQPLADEINKLIGTKDTRALARAGAGDWESTGTNKGWMLGQISNSFQGLPPSIKQQMQAELLKNNSDEIQDMAPGQANVQKNARWFANNEEDQTGSMYTGYTKKASAVQGMTGAFNDMQLNLFNTGLKFVDTINDTIETLNDLSNTIPRVKKAFDTITDAVKNPSLTSASRAIGAVSDVTPRAHK